MASYLIDFENVHHHGLLGIEKLTQDDYVVIFVGSKDKSISLEAAISLSKSRANIVWKRAEKTAPNYLDIQIASYLGLLIGEEKSNEFYIVSKDQGFIAATDFWSSRKTGIKVELLETISGTPLSTVVEQKETPKKAATPPAAEEKLKTSIKKNIATIMRKHNLIGGNYTKVHSIFLKSKTEAQFLSIMGNTYQGKKSLREDLLPVFKDYLQNR